MLRFCVLLATGMLLLATASGLGAQEFKRGDANGDGCVDAADAEYITDVIFGGAETFRCEDAADVNDDGVIELADAIHVLDYVQSGGPEPHPPFPDCGPDSADDNLGCEEYTACDKSCVVDVQFIRGDANGDGTITIADPIFTLGFLFSGSAPPDCDDAVDVNDDGQLDVSDAVFGLICLFAGGRCPDDFQSCTVDKTTDGLAECERELCP